MATPVPDLGHVKIDGVLCPLIHWTIDYRVNVSPGFPPNISDEIIGRRTRIEAYYTMPGKIGSQSLYLELKRPAT